MGALNCRSIWKYIHIALVLNFTNGMKFNSSSHVLCNDGRAIRRDLVCDGIPDCVDGSDEIYTGTGFKCSLPPRQNLVKQTRRCVLPESMVHDNVPHCEDGSDLCFDEKKNVIPSRCFECLDGNGIISLTQVCDAIVDCHDLSDECTCTAKPKSSEHGERQLLRNDICQQMRYSGSFKRSSESRSHPCKIGEILCKSSNTTTISTVSCISPFQVCDGTIDCPLGDDEVFCPTAGYQCHGSDGIIGIFCDGRIDCEDFDDECSTDCWLPNQFCDNITSSHDNRTEFKCDATNNSDVIKGYDVCNRVMDCGISGKDEMNCLASTHFYCIGKSPLFVNWSNHLDGIRDCEDGSDECGKLVSASRIHHLRNRDTIIRSGVMIFSVWSMCFLAIVGNTVVAWQTLRELWKDWREEKLGKLAKCNRILVLNLALSDILMGIYLLSIGIASATMDGRYCVQDRLWRTSTTCVALGFINQLSNETSVLTLVLMTSSRLYGILHPFKVERSHVVHCSLISCAAIWIISIAVATTPLLEVVSDYFTQSVWLPLPLVTSDRVLEEELRELVIRLNTVTFNTTEKLKDYSWTTMLKFLRDLNVKGIHPGWSLDKLTLIGSLGFYNQYPMCIPNLYPNRTDTAWAYSTSIIVFNFCAFCFIAIAYFVIYKASSRPAVRKSVRKRSRQWRRDNKAMQKKIFVLSKILK